MAVPATTSQTDLDPLYAPNDPCPDEWSDYLLNTFHDYVYTTLTRNRVPWLIVKQLADEGWTDVTSLTKRWGTEEQLYSKAVSSLRIASLQPHQQEKIVASLAGAREDLRKKKDYDANMANRPRAAQLVDTSDREIMQEAFYTITGEKLKLKYQGSAKLDRTPEPRYGGGPHRKPGIQRPDGLPPSTKLAHYDPADTQQRRLFLRSRSAHPTQGHHARRMEGRL